MACEHGSDMTVVLVTFTASPQQRAILVEVLGETASVIYIEDLEEDERAAAFRAADVLMSGSFAREVREEERENLKRARLIQTLSAGVDRFPFHSVPENIEVASNAGAYAEPMAEHVVAMTLALAKNLEIQDANLRQGQFDHATPNRLLHGMTAGIIGFGGVGRATGRLMRALGMRVLAVNTSGGSEAPVDFVGTLVHLEYVLREADLVVLSLPLTRETRGLIDGRRLGWMKEDAILINVARGHLIDQKSLYDHASSHPDFLVGLDVWWNEPFAGGAFRTQYPLLDLPNVMGSPHNSGNVLGVDLTATRHAAKNVLRYLKGEQVVGLVRHRDYV